MHYYQFNIGDYRKDTTHLTEIEHYIYRTLLDQYYLNEEPLKDDIGYMLRILRLSSDRSTTVEQVLNEFFTKVEQGWIQVRAKGEIEAYNRRRKSASEAGKKSAKARKYAACEPAFNDRSTTVQLTNNHKPITNNHSFRKPTVSEIHEYCSERMNGLDAQKIFDHYETCNWFRGKTKIKDWRACVRTWEKKNPVDENDYMRRGI